MASGPIGRDANYLPGGFQSVTCLGNISKVKNHDQTVL